MLGSTDIGACGASVLSGLGSRTGSFGIDQLSSVLPPGSISDDITCSTVFKASHSHKSHNNPKVVYKRHELGNNPII